MNVNFILKISILYILILLLIPINIAQAISSPTIAFEIFKDDQTQTINFYSDDIEKIGINERSGEIRIEIKFKKQNYSILENLTKKNVGNKIIIRTNNEKLFSGTIYEPIQGGIISFSSPSEKNAIAIIRRMGKELDYHLKLTPEEDETSKRYKEPLQNPWAKKAIDAITVNHDLESAKQFAINAIQSDPYEPAYHEILSTIYYKQGNKSLALEEMLKAEKLSKEEALKRSPGIFLGIADLYADYAKYEKAIEYINKVLSTNENNMTAHLDLAEVYEKMEKYDLAVKEYLYLSKSNDEHFQNMGMEGLKRLKEK